MKTKNIFKGTVITLILFALLSMSFKIKPIMKAYENFLPKEVFKVNYNFFTKGSGKQIFIKSYLPKDNERQKISNINNSAELLTFETINEDENKRGIWKSSDDEKRFYEVNYSFIFKGKASKYNIGENLPIVKAQKNINKKYLAPEEHIQVFHPSIDSLANALTANTNNLKSRIKSLYDYVFQIPSAPIKDLTSALKTLEQNKASCNGKSRLLVALCRNQGIPARLVGGIILEKVKKRTSHLWVEIYIQNKWVPFDPLNGHFAYLPANFLELYTGDHFLITRSTEILFDYEYQIDEVNHIPLVNITTDDKIINHPISLLKLSDSGIMPKSILTFLLLLPLGGLLISLFKNVVGLKTYGIFLPILIAYTLTNTGYITGIALFLLIVGVVALSSLPLNKWGLLYTPKIVIILTIAVLFIFGLINIGLHYNIEWILALSFFPIIITAIMAERFARAIDEDGYQEALSKMLQTLIATSFCYLVFKSVAIKTLLLIFPELIIIMLAVNLLLGKWIGLRLIEYNRFKFIIS